MASTYTTRLRIEKPGNGEQAGTWGITTNNDFDLLDQSVAGVVTVTHNNAANYTLTALSGSSDEARNMALVIGGTLTANRNVVIPAVQKVYLVRNATSGGFAITVKTSGGIGLQIANGFNQWVFCDATNVFAATPAFNPTTGSFLGNVATADRWTTARTITLSGDASGSVAFDGSADATLALTIPGLAQAGVQSISLAGTTPRAGQVTITEADTVNILLSGNIVRSFQGATTRTGSVVLTSGDVTGALGFTPVQTFNSRAGNVLLLASDVTQALGSTAVQNAVNAQTASTATTFTGNIAGSQVQGNITGNAASITGNIAGSQVSGNITGNAATATTATTATSATTATRWASPRTISLSGAVTGSQSFDGSGNFSVSTSFQTDPVFSGTAKAGNFNLSNNTTGLLTDGNLARSLQFDVGDLIGYNTSSNEMAFAIATVPKLTLAASAATFSVAATGPSFTSTSDRTLKDDIRPITGGLERVLDYQPVSWVWKSTSPFASFMARQSGFVAQDVQPVNPMAVVQPASENGHPAIDPMAIIADLVDAVRTLSERVAALEAQ